MTLKLVDRRSVCYSAISELQETIKDIKRGEVTGISFVATNRDGNLYCYSYNECQVRGLGAVEMLKSHIIQTKFK